MIPGSTRHVVRLQRPGAPVADGDGGFTQVWTDLTPATWDCSIEPATARDLERVAAGTVIATATHVLKGRFHAGITVATRVLVGGRQFSGTGVANPEERNLETIATAVEVVN